MNNNANYSVKEAKKGSSKFIFHTSLNTKRIIHTLKNSC